MKLLAWFAPLLIALFASCAPKAANPDFANFPVKPGDNWLLEVQTGNTVQSYRFQPAGPLEEGSDKTLIVMPLSTQPGYGGKAIYDGPDGLFSVGVYTAQSRRDFLICFLDSGGNYAEPVSGYVKFYTNANEVGSSNCRVSKP